MQRFFDKVEKTDTCWIWKAYCCPQWGYGIFGFKGKLWKAHRFSYFYHRKKHPGKMLVCHHCDTPACVNPEHLFLGTNLDNTMDKVLKYRTHNQKKTVCSKGHRLGGDNLRIVPSDTGLLIERQCITCARNRSKRYYVKHIEKIRKSSRELQRELRKKLKESTNV
jgi:hypothetical protein